MIYLAFLFHYVAKISFVLNAMHIPVLFMFQSQRTIFSCRNSAILRG